MSALDEMRHALGLGERVRRILIDVRDDHYAPLVYIQQDLVSAEPLMALMVDLSAEQISGGRAQRISPPVGPDETMGRVLAYLDRVDPSDDRTNPEPVEQRLQRIVEFYRGAHRG